MPQAKAVAAVNVPVIAADARVTAANGAVIASDAPVIAADAMVIASDGAVIASDGAVIAADAAVIAADGVVIAADGAVIAADGAVIASDAVVIASDAPVRSVNFAGGVVLLAMPPRKADNPRVSALQNLLASFRDAALTNRERGTYFEELVVKYLTHEPAYRDLYREVLPYADWADRRGLDKRDAGIDLVAETFAGDAHAIQCKLYAADYRVQKADLDSFFTASGKRPFSHRLIVATTSRWSDHAEEALRDQHTPVTKLDLAALEQSVIDWSRYAAKKAPRLKPKKSLRPHQQSAVTSVAAGLAKAPRGKLIMACGTGKTFTSLKIA